MTFPVGFPCSNWSRTSEISTAQFSSYQALSCPPLLQAPSDRPVAAMPAKVRVFFIFSRSFLRCCGGVFWSATAVGIIDKWVWVFIVELAYFRAIRCVNHCYCHRAWSVNNCVVFLVGYPGPADIHFDFCAF